MFGIRSFGRLTRHMGRSNLSVFYQNTRSSSSFERNISQTELATELATAHAYNTYNDDEKAIQTSLKEQIKKDNIDKSIRYIHNTEDDRYFTEMAMKHSCCGVEISKLNIKQ